MASYKIGEAAQRTGCAAATIRYYERVGLVPSARRGPNGYRYYSDADLERLQFVSKARELGFPIASVQSLLQLASHPEQPCDAVDERVAEQLETVRDRIAQLRRLETRLINLQAACDGQYPINECRILAALGQD